LELVLALPILLFMMALIINFGTVSAWKVRSLTVARYQLWGNSSPRSVTNYPQPANWPDSADRDTNSLGNISSLDKEEVKKEVARGPQFSSGGCTMSVYEDVLDPSRGARDGTSDLTRAYPLLPKLQSYNLHGATMFLDDKWQYWRMYWHGQSTKWSMWSNTDLRIPVIYSLPWDMSLAYTGMESAAPDADEWGDSRFNIIDNKDADDISYRIRFPGPDPLPHWHGLGDLHPRLRNFCSLDYDVAQAAVDQLVERIKRVPGRLTRRCLSMYQFALTHSTDPSEMSQLQEQIAFLRNF
jgi:hypothetical protein